MKINKTYSVFLRCSTAIVLIITLGTACQTVKPYQRAYLNDSAMKMGGNKNAGFENYAHLIREGASGAGGKNSGGCGCN